MLGLNVFVELYQEAIVSYKHAQRKVRLHLVEAVGAQKALAKGRHPEIDESGGERTLT